MATSINDDIVKRIENLAEKSNQNINDYLKDLIDEEEKMNDPDYLEFIKSTEKAWLEIDQGECKTLTVDEFMEELNNCKNYPNK